MLLARMCSCKKKGDSSLQDRLWVDGAETILAARENFSEYLGLNPPGGIKSKMQSTIALFARLNLYHVDAEKQLQDFIDNYPS